MSSDSIFAPVQEKVLALLSAGHTATAAAASAGIHRNTVGNWLRSSAFRQALTHIQYQKALLWRENAEALAPAAFDTIRQIMANPRAAASVRLRAALAIKETVMSPLPAHPDDQQRTISMHNDAQPVSLLPELLEAPEPQPEPAPVHNPAQPPGGSSSVPLFSGALHRMHNGAQPLAANRLPRVISKLMAEMAEKRDAQLRPDPQTKTAPPPSAGSDTVMG